MNEGKLFYTIGEVATKFEVNTSLIRFWEKEFDIINPQKNKKGNRLFTQKDIDNFHLIFHLVKQKGYTLDGAKNKIKTEPHSFQKETKKNIEIVETLSTIKSFLLHLKEQL